MCLTAHYLNETQRGSTEHIVLFQWHYSVQCLFPQCSCLHVPRAYNFLTKIILPEVLSAVTLWLYTSSAISMRISGQMRPSKSVRLNAALAVFRSSTFPSKQWTRVRHVTLVTSDCQPLPMSVAYNVVLCFNIDHRSGLSRRYLIFRRSI